MIIRHPSYGRHGRYQQIITLIFKRIKRVHGLGQRDHASSLFSYTGT